MGKDEELTGTTLRVYAYLISKAVPVGPREVAKELGLSSPSLAYYHLKKLEELGLAKKTPEGYVGVPGGRVRGFIFIGRKLVPRLAFYVALFVGLLAFEVTDVILRLFTYKEPLRPEDLMMITSTTIALIIFITESLIARKSLK